MRSHAPFLCLLVLGSAGCFLGPTETSCTEIGCVDGLGVDFRSASGTYAAGTYHVGIVADGKTITCTATLPFTNVNEPSACSSTEVILGTSGSALAASAHALTGLLFTTSPRMVSITITRDAKPFASASLAPSYVTSQPNGPGCEPICTSAHEVVDVP